MAMLSLQIKHTAFDGTSVKKYLVVYSVKNLTLAVNFSFLSTAHFVNALILGTSAVESEIIDCQ